MRKVTGKARPGDAQQQAPTAPPCGSPPWIKAKAPAGGSSGSAVLISLHVKPGSRLCSVSVSEQQLDVAIHAPAREGEANTEVVEYLASLLRVRRAAVTLAAGGKSHDKVLAIEGLTEQEALSRLREAAAS